MKCKRCGNEINLEIFGMPHDLCYGCLTVGENDAIVRLNAGIAVAQVTEDNLKEEEG